MYRTVDRRRIDSNRVFRWHDDQWLVKALGMARTNNVAHILLVSPSKNRQWSSKTLPVSIAVPIV